MRQHPNNRHNRQKQKFPCPICEKVLSSKCILEAHVSRHTGECLYYYCDKCEFNTPHRGVLQNHRKVRHLGLKTVARPKKFQCKKCDRSFPCKASLANHMVVHNDDMPFICTFPGCEFRSKYRPNLKQHEGRHSSKRKFPRTMCHKRFHTDYEMERHVLRIHTAEKSVKCELCPYIASTTSALSNHMKKHMNDRNSNAEASSKLTRAAAAANEKSSECDDYSGSDEELQRCSNGYYYCGHAGCAFRTKYDYYIDKHRRRVHAQQRPHTCCICSKRFFDELTLVGHMRTHTGERPFKCPFCSYAATLHPNIQRHIKFRHADKNRNSKFYTKLTKDGDKVSEDVLLSSLEPVVRLERIICLLV